MSLQEIFYLVAIIFMLVVLVLIIVGAVLSFNLINRLQKIANATEEFIDRVAEKGGRILDSAEQVIPKIIEAISVGKYIKEAVKEWKKK